MYARHAIEQAQAFGPESAAVIGLRHLDAGDRACFAGAIADARIYDRALTPEEIAGLRPHSPAGPEPFAWWDFAEGSLTDNMGRFPECVAVGGPRLAGGRLLLSGKECYLIAAPAGSAARGFARPASAEAPLVSASRRLRAHLLADRHRPAYHFTAPEGSCMPFDPNGALFWRGRYHLCYIFQNERGHCWGHASSSDLVHWRHHPTALAPHPGDPDGGIFSGNAFVSKEGEAVLLYHGVGAGNCIATSREEHLEHWTKLPSNPIVPSPKEGDADFGKYSSWDPHGWLEEDTYYAIFGGNPATLFRSPDMVRWEFRRRFLEHNLPGVDADEDISCPDFFPLGGRHLLLCISHKRGCRYYLGRWENERFTPETHARMNWPGGTCFAPESLLDDKGRRIFWAWVLDQAGTQTRGTAWSGVMTLPRVLSLDADGTLGIAPAEELQVLRTQPRSLGSLPLPADAEVPLPGVRGDCLELLLEMAPGAAGACGVKVRCSPDGEEQTAIAYEPARGCLRIDLSRSTRDASVVYRTFCMTGVENPAVTAQEAPFALRVGEPLRLRIFLDRSLLEVFANDRQCLTQRLYPTRDDSLGVALFAHGAGARVTRCDAWQMAPANPW